MRLLSSFSAALLAFSGATSVVSAASLNSYISKETTAAYNGLMANIGSKGAKSVGALEGVVVAAPSDSPNYKYTWVRDSSLVFKYLVDEYISGAKPQLLSLIQSWIAGESVLQNIDNPSGLARAGGLGEPKFELNLTAFTGSWGRPQRDGPGLRAITIIKFANYLLDRRQSTSYVTGTLWPILELDLNYVRDFWNTTGFDLWEEENGSSFFTSAAQHRALRVGATFAKRIGHSDSAAQYTTQANAVLCFLQSFWSGSYIISNINLQSSRTGLDANSLLTSIHNFDFNAGCDAATFQPCSDKALANHLAVVDSFRSIYTINAGISNSSAVAIGRYAEDVYYNGNPWYLSVNAAAEQLYYAVAQWRKAGEITITSISLPFFQRVVPWLKLKTGRVNLVDYLIILVEVEKYADEFLAINQKYTPSNGALSEQFDRNNGTQTSANDLTWSYASALTAFNARAGKFPAPWGAQGLKVPTGTCATNPVPTIPVTFTVTGDPYSAAWIVGSITQLGSWDPNSSVPMTAGSTSGTYTVTLQLAIDQGFEYKYIYKNADGSISWNTDPNYSTILPASGSKNITDAWR